MTREYFEELFKQKLLEKVYEKFEREFATGEYHSEEDAVDTVAEEIVKG